MTARMVLRLSVIRVPSFNSGCGARSPVAGRLPVEAMERRAKIVEHGREVAGQRVTTAD